MTIAAGTLGQLQALLTSSNFNQDRSIEILARGILDLNTSFTSSGLLGLSGGVPLTATPVAVGDELGNTSPLLLSTTNVKMASSTLLLGNAAGTFAYTIVGGALLADRSLTLPLITGADTLAALNVAQLWTAGQTFSSSVLKINNPGATFAYTIVGSAIAAARNLTIPLLSGNDTMAVLGLDQTFSGNIIMASSTVGTNSYFGWTSKSKLTSTADGSVTAFANDGSTPAFINAKIQTSAAATTGLSAGVLAASTNASVVVYDSTGQAYRVPCII